MFTYYRDEYQEMSYPKIETTQPREIKFISIEGNIGAGKSTLLRKMNDYINEYDINKDEHIVFLKEPVDIWESITDDNGKNMLELFYENPSKYAFLFQTMVYATQKKLIHETIEQNPACTIIISERSLDAGHNLFTKMLHADGFMTNLEYKIYQQLIATEQNKHCFSNGNYILKQSNTVLFLDIEPEICIERINKRSRIGEDAIQLDYLKKCDLFYRKWLLEGEGRMFPKENVIQVFDNKDVIKITNSLLFK